MKSKNRSIIRFGVTCAAILFVFLYGFGVGHYRWFPFDELMRVKNRVLGRGNRPKAVVSPPDPKALQSVVSQSKGDTVARRELLKTKVIVEGSETDVYRMVLSSDFELIIVNLFTI